MTSTHQPILADLKAAFTPMPFDSEEEEWFTWMLDELVEAGYCLGYERAQTFCLFGGETRTFHKGYKAKRGQVTVEKDLLKPVHYTADFVISWSRSVYGSPVAQDLESATRCLSEEIPFIYVHEDGELITHIEVKPFFNITSSQEAAPLARKWLWDKERIYVNVVKPGARKGSFFDRFWTPRRFLVTPKLQRPRILKFTPRSLPEFIQQTSAKLAGFLP